MKTSPGPIRARRLTAAALIVLALLLLVGVSEAGLFDRFRKTDKTETETETKEEAEESYDYDAGAETPPGRWRTAREWEQQKELTDEQRDELSRIGAIGYLGAVNPAPAASGVTVHDKSRAYQGYNFYTSGHLPGAVLMDMEGNVLHEWRLEFQDAWPDCPEDIYRADLEFTPKRMRNPDFWFRARLLENGSVISLFEDLGIFQVDSRSQLQWKLQGRFHHDFDIRDDGVVYALVRRPTEYGLFGRGEMIYDDGIALIGPDGLIGITSIINCIIDSPYVDLLYRMKRKGDLLHTNTLEILDGRLASRLPAFKKGNILISLRESCTIAVIDLEAEKVVWALDGMWVEQHHPTVLDNGNIMIFDNRGNYGKSEILEFDPVTQEVEWEYKGDGTFFSRQCGANQRLPNGNTLITESDYGRAFEITPAGDIVWEFVNPARGGENNELIATILDVVRIPPDFPLDWLGNAE